MRERVVLTLLLWSGNTLILSCNELKYCNRNMCPRRGREKRDAPVQDSASDGSDSEGPSDSRQEELRALRDREARLRERVVREREACRVAVEAEEVLRQAEARAQGIREAREVLMAVLRERKAKDKDDPNSGPPPGST